jgi:uroporphyrinogen III methyltransferase/synthase
LVKGQRLLLARADRGREVLVAELSRIAAVEQLALYTQNECRRLSPEVGELLRQGRLDFVTLTSTNIARGFLHLLGPAERAAVGKSIRLVTISPVTSAAVRELGFEVSAEAATYTGEGVVQAVVRLAVT